MPFSFKNAKTTYQSDMTIVFHDMLHECLEDYIEDIIVKSKEIHYHVDDPKKSFKNCRQYKLEGIPWNVSLIFFLVSLFVI